mgnify:FL=1
MGNKLIITQNGAQLCSALFVEEELTELHLTEVVLKRNKAAVGDIYVGRVKKIQRNLDAAFIEIAPHTECYYSMKQYKTPFFTKKIGKKPLCEGEELLVQVSREASGVKAPSVTTGFNLAGKYAVLTYENTTLGVSGKIELEKKQELKEWLQKFRNSSYGLILRTNAGTADRTLVEEEIRQLIGIYKRIEKTATHRPCFSRIYQEEPEYIRQIRNQNLEKLEEIIVEEDWLYEEILQYLKTGNQDVSCLRKYRKETLSLHKLYNLDQEIQKATQEKVWLKNGGYLVIQHTEALHVIDVNSGKYIKGKDAQKTYRKINEEAAKEAARQIRLRNLSGIILIDFINFSDKEEQQDLLSLLERFVKKDPIPTNVIDITKLHLVELTRKKVQRPLYECMQFGVY